MEKALQNNNIVYLNFEIFYFGNNNRREKRYWVFGFSGKTPFGNFN